MGAGNLGLLLYLGMDDSEAKQTIASFQKSIEGTFAQLPTSAEPFNKALLNQHQTLHLLAEEAGVHLPRAVISGVSEMLPPINMIGPALLAAFAIAEIPKFIDEIHDAADEMEGFGTEAKKAFEDAVAASDKALTHFKSLKEGIRLEAEVNRNIAALTRERDVLESTGGVAINYAKSFLAFATGYVASGGAFLAMAQAQQQAQKELAKGEQQRLEQLNTKTELEERQNRKAEEEAQRLERLVSNEWQMVRRWQPETPLALREMTAGALAYNAAMAVSAERTREADIFLKNLIIDEIRESQLMYQNAALARTAQPHIEIYQQVQAVKHLSLARKELTGITQDLHHVEDAFSQALRGDMSAIEGLTQAAGSMAGEFVSMIAGTKAAAIVRGSFDAALAIEYMAAFIASHFIDTDALQASIEYGSASAAMFAAAGGGGGSRGGGGGSNVGGNQSRYGADQGGGSGSGGDSSTRSGGGSGHVTIIWHQYGPTGNMADFVRTFTGVQNALVGSGQIKVIATHARQRGPYST